MAILARAIILAILLQLGSCTILQAQEANREYQLKLAFLVNFARFITWPEDTLPPEQVELTICIFGENPFASFLAGVEARKVGERSLVIKNLENLEDVRQCQLLFVGRSDAESFSSLRSKVAQLPIVIVSDIPGSAAIGGAIEFVLKDDRLSFIINNSDLKERRVQASSSLLNLAVSIW